MHVTNYDLFIDLDFDKCKFKGKLLIKLTSAQDVILNSVELDVLRVRSGKTDFQFREDGEELIIDTGSFDGILEIDFAGSIPDTLAGIYRALYDHSHIITTQFEAAQARRMFPCVDRPDAKAEFILTVKINKDLDAISNTPIETVKVVGEKKIVTFRKTPLMSTYLLYLGVGKFEERIQKLNATEIIMATTPGKTNLGKYAQDEACRAIQFFNSYYNIPYKLPKIHLIAVPEISMGAMENWGAITFSETALLTSTETSTRARRRVAEIVDHELAHQWFGNLVTMKWWNDIWLNESFATFMAYKVISEIHSEWNCLNDFLMERTGGAMTRDSLQNTHSIEVPVKTPDEIEQIFDAISYGKGASILRMVEAYIGEQTFRDGVRQYLSKYAYSNASSKDFWTELEAISGKQIGKIMVGWIRQPGYPIITVSMNKEKLVLRQKRFLLSNISVAQTWPIPVTLQVNGELKSFLFEKSEESFNVGDVKSLKINLNRTGFYLVHYEGLNDLVWNSDLSPTDRWGMVHDGFALLVSGKIQFPTYLQLLGKFTQEAAYLPAYEVSNQLALLYTIIPTKCSEFSRDFHRSQLEVLQHRTDENSLILLATISSRLALLDNTYAEQLASMFKRYDSVSPDLKQAVAIAYARTTNDFETLVNVFRRVSSNEDKVRILNAMTSFSDEELIKRTLNFSLSGEVKRQDIRNVARMAAEKPTAINATWEWLSANIVKLRELYRGTGLLSDTLLSLIPIVGIGRVVETEAFFNTHRIPDAEIGIIAGLEKLKAYDRLVKAIME
jgi:tricorn protease interacting factor F2/3